MNSCAKSQVEDPKPIRIICPGGVCWEQNPLQFDCVAAAMELELELEQKHKQEREQFPGAQSSHFFPQMPLLQPDFPLITESHDFITRFPEQNLLDEFEESALGAGQLPVEPLVFQPYTNMCH